MPISAVLSVTMIQTGEAFNIIPRTVKMTGTVRTLDPEVRDLMESRLKSVTEGLTATFGAKATVTYRRGYPVTAAPGVTPPPKEEHGGAMLR